MGDWTAARVNRPISGWFAKHRNPAVREILSLVTGVQPTSARIDPETAVALGAAILSSIMDNQMTDMQARKRWISFETIIKYENLCKSA